MFSKPFSSICVRKNSFHSSLERSNVLCGYTRIFSAQILVLLTQISRFSWWSSIETRAPRSRNYWRYSCTFNRNIVKYFTSISCKVCWCPLGWLFVWLMLIFGRTAVPKAPNPVTTSFFREELLNAAVGITQQEICRRNLYWVKIINRLFIKNVGTTILHFRVWGSIVRLYNYSYILAPFSSEYQPESNYFWAKCYAY